MVTVVVVQSAVPNRPFSPIWTSEMAEAVGVATVALLASAILLRAGYRMLRRLAVFDDPNERSSHITPTIRGMGMAVLLAWGVTVVMASQPPLGFILGVAFIVLLGAIDDFRSLPSALRLISQIVLSAVVAISLIGVLRPEMPFALALIVLTIFLTATVNSVNFMDGINGMSSLHAGIWGVTYALVLVAFVRPDSPWTTVVAALTGAFLAFLPWNARRSARGFLGDSGSYGLGVVVGSVAVVTWAVTGSWIAALLPLGVYGFDTLLTAIRRLLAGKNLFEAHREHVYQRNAVRTRSALQATTVTVIATSVLCVLAILFAYALVNLWIVLFIGVLTVVVYSVSPLFIGSKADNRHEVSQGVK